MISNEMASSAVASLTMPSLAHEQNEETSNPRKDTESSLSTLSQTERELEPADEGNNRARTASGTALGTWASNLSSPTVAAFSPALDGTNSLHGCALLHLTKRAGYLNQRYGKQTANVLSQLPTLYEAFAQALKKAALVTLQPIAFGLPQPQLQGIHFSSLQETVIAWSTELFKLADTLRVSIGQSLQAYLMTHAETVQSLLQRYQQSKSVCPVARQRALAARSKYLRLANSVSNPDAAAAASGNASSSPLSSTLPDTGVSASVPGSPSEESSSTNNRARLLKRASSVSANSNNGKVRSLRNQEERYKRLVLKENNLVKQCQRVEGMALETLEQLEDDCLLILQQAFEGMLSTQQGTMDRIKAIVEKCKEGPTPEDLAETEKKFFQQQQNARKTMNTPAANFGKLLKSSNLLFLSDDSETVMANNNNTGVMDADTLGLPEDIGKLRDSCRARMESWATRIQVVRVLSTFLEIVASASAKLGIGLDQLLSQTTTDSSKDNGDKFRDSFPALYKWGSVLSVFDLERQSLLDLAASLRKVRQEKLDKVVLSGDKSIKMASDSDETLWKQLCEAARAQSRAEMRYRQSSAITAKARERVKSVDSDKGSQLQQQLNANKVNQHMTKSLANLVSFFPDGGEKAMKILAPGTRASIAQRQAEEADSKEVKERQLLDLAVESTARAIEAYKMNGEAILSSYTAEDKTGWDNVGHVTDTFIASLESMRSTRSEKLLQLLTSTKESCSENSWLQDLRENVMLKVTESEEPACSSLAGFMLIADVSPTFLNSKDHAEEEAAARTEVDDISSDESEPGERNAPTTPLRESSSFLGDSAFLSTSLVNPMDDLNPANWLKSLNTPVSPAKASNTVGASSARRERLPSDGGKANDCTLGKSSDAYAYHSETEVFINYFWRDAVDKDSIPRIVESFACCFKDAGKTPPRFYGRLFLSSERFIFVSWTGKKRSRRWSDVLEIQPVNSPLSQREDSISVKFKKGNTEDELILLCGFVSRESALEIASKLKETAKVAEAITSKSIVLENVPGPAVPPDETIRKMEVAVSRQIRNISIKRFYDIAWAEGEETDEKPLYRPWLERACFDIEFGEWEQKDVIGPWCGETYTQRRVIKFKVQRKTHLYIGPPIANVTQTHYCRIEGDSKCVLAMTCEFDGLPYSDSFSVELRWVASRDGANDILVEVGIFVDFKKSMLNMIKQKIRSGTIEETTPVQKKLFETITEACVAAGGEGVEEEVTEQEVPVVKPPDTSANLSAPESFEKYAIVAVGIVVLWAVLWRFFSRSSRATDFSMLSGEMENISRRMDQMESEIRLVKDALNEVLALLKEQARQ